MLVPTVLLLRKADNQNCVLRSLTVTTIIPALMMLVGIAELIHERICKQNRILPGYG